MSNQLQVVSNQLLVNEIAQNLVHPDVLVAGSLTLYLENTPHHPEGISFFSDLLVLTDMS